MSSDISKIEGKGAKCGARGSARLTAEDLERLRAATELRLDRELAARKAAALAKRAENEFEIETQELNGLVTHLIRKYGGRPLVDQIADDGTIEARPSPASPGR